MTKRKQGDEPEPQDPPADPPVPVPVDPYAFGVECLDVAVRLAGVDLEISAANTRAVTRAARELLRAYGAPVVGEARKPLPPGQTDRRRGLQQTKTP